MFVKSQKVPKDEMHLDDYLQERYGPEGSIGLLMVVAIPFLGGFINVIVVVLGLGALWLLGWELIRSRPTGAKAPAESTD